jgi:anti-anti-sigma factor
MMGTTPEDKFSTEAVDEAATPAFSVTVKRYGSALTVRVRGDVDWESSPKLDVSLALALEERPAVLVVDLTDVTSFSSSGISALVHANQQAGATKFRVVAPGRVTYRRLELAGLTEVIAVYRSLPDELTTD